MFLYVSKVFRAAVAGAVLKDVTCEKCGTQFHYVLSRLGYGQGSAPYMVGQNAAQNRAQASAQGDLQARLARDCELVPCPSCRWINGAAIKQFRGTRHQLWFWGAVFITLLGVLVDLILYYGSEDIFRKPRDLWNNELWIFTAIWASLVGLLLTIRFLLRRRINPNRAAGGNLRLPPGTPPALVQRGVDAAGNPIFDVVPSESPDDPEPRWAIFRAGQFHLAPLCCRCLDQPTAAYTMPFVFSQPPMPVPLCRPCLRRYRLIWWVANLASPVLAYFVGRFVSTLPHQIDSFGRGFIVILVTGFGAVVGFAAIDELLRPYRLRTVDMARGITKIRFRNPAYTAILVKRTREQDGIIPAPAAPPASQPSQV